MSQYEYLISACLCGRHCRYDGNEKQHEKSMALYAQGKAVLICPEVMGGMSTPRLPSEIIEGKVIAQDGSDVSEQFASGARQSVLIAKSLNIKKAILKEGSPSCGVHQVYDGTFRGFKIPGMGVSAKALKEAGIAVMSDEETE